MYLIPVFSRDSGAAAPRLCAALCLLAALALPVRAHSGAAGPGEFAAIAVVPAARPAGLAGAWSALAEGAGSIGLNPAGLARESGRHFSGSLRPDLVRVGSVAYTVPGYGGRLAFSASYVDYAEILSTDEYGRATGTLHPFSLYPALSYARASGERWRWGTTIKLARESLGDFEGAQVAYGAGVDAGVQYQPAVRNLGFGLSVTNVGRKFTSPVEGGDASGPLPAAVKGGMFYHPRGRKQMTLTADVEAPFYGRPVLAVGTEYRVIAEWDLRAGTRWDSDDLRTVYGWVVPGAEAEPRGGEAVKLAAGTTVRVGPVEVDYAAQWWRELGVVHSLSVAWAFD
jgi:hypothetical protein